MIVGVLAIAGASVNAGWFGAGVKPVPYVKVPLVKLVVPCSVSSCWPKSRDRGGCECFDTSGANVALPWVRGSGSQMA